MTDVTRHPDFRALMASVRARPNDDAPRVVIADWLREHDEEAWADFVEWQLANPTVRLSRAYRTLDGDGHWHSAFYWDRAMAVTGKVYALQALGNPAVRADGEGFGAARAGWMPLSALTWWKWTWRRGFPERVRLPVEPGLDAVLALLLNDWPVREVVAVGTVVAGLDNHALDHVMAQFRRRGVAWYTEPMTWTMPGVAFMTNRERRRVLEAAAEIDANVAARLKRQLAVRRRRTQAGVPYLA